MTNDELGKKIEEAAYLLRIVREGPNQWPLDKSPEDVRIAAREELGKTVREILVEGVRTVQVLGIEPADSTTPSQTDEKGRPMTYWGGRPDNGDAPRG